MIKITAKNEGFRRAGKAFSKEGKTYPDDCFTKDQLKVLKNEPMLVVTSLPDLPEKDSKEVAHARKILGRRQMKNSRLNAMPWGLNIRTQQSRPTWLN